MFKPFFNLFIFPFKFFSLTINEAFRENTILIFLALSSLNVYGIILAG
jgi:NADH:ubiquinone oxidoreductase subunit H